MGLLNRPTPKPRLSLEGSSSTPTALLPASPLLNGSRHTFIKLLVISLGLALIAAAIAQVIASQPSLKQTAAVNSTHTSYSSTNISGTSGQQSISTPVTSSSPEPYLQVSVNGQSIQVPKNGSTEDTITTAQGSTTVKISNSSNSSGNANSSNITTVKHSSVNTNSVSGSTVEVHYGSP